MKLLAWHQRLLPEQFVIDEQPLPVCRPEHPSPDQPPVPGALLPVEAIFEEGIPPANGSAAPASPDDLLTQVMRVLSEQQELAAKASRLEKAGSGSDEFGRFVRNLLPFMDNFAHLLDLARENPPSDELTGWLSSVEALYFRATNLLESYGLRFINSAGKVVNLDIHDVVEYRQTDQYPHNTVIKELQKGVVFRDRLIREAKVVVACND